eukprot:gnl/MRDRNA2_/MRDRNA2_72301_c0_seq1.p1 gnl/MRDRNA2_/MRDRNA2_72301_c0~~gnl/MRDRNA2_/MRDRNA2_72301_c0_seq1.p1  ORF type:complete len:396 (-),score=56.16 gnl/MRDRNA2_/MRDRNA2_72301_c0_seq1:119-1306(-)
MPRAIDGFMGAAAGKHVDAYFEYCQLVGRLDGGKPLPEPVYEDLKQKAMNPARRLYVNWRNVDSGIDCKAIGPQSMCLCTHRYNEHNWSDFEGRKVGCKMPGCPCKCFSYVPVRGSQDLICSNCRRSYKEHRPLNHGCPTGDGEFTSSYICSCSGGYSKHRTVFESRNERVQAGRAIDSDWMDKCQREGLPVCHLGGILGFTSLADGVDRAMAGLEQGIDPDHAISHGAVPDMGANRFVSMMQMHDTVNNASICHGKAAGFKALAKAKAQHRRQQSLPPGSSSAASSSPGPKQMSVPGAPNANVHGFTSSSASAIAPGPGPKPPALPAPKAYATSPKASMPAAQGKASMPTVTGAAGQRSRSTPSGSSSGGHRLGGVRKHDPEAVRRARLARFDE